MENQSALNSETSIILGEPVTDYWLSKLFFDVQRPGGAARYRNDRARLLADYLLSPDLRSAVLTNDVARLAPHTNPYLLRYFFAAIGMSDGEFIARLRGTVPEKGAHADG